MEVGWPEARMVNRRRARKNGSRFTIYDSRLLHGTAASGGCQRGLAGGRGALLRAAAACVSMVGRGGPKGRRPAKEKVREEGFKGVPGGGPRVAASSYLNSAPLIWSFLHGPRRDEVRLWTDAAP